MRPIVIVLIVLALGTAAIAAILMQRYLQSQTVVDTTPTVQTGTTNVLVAARDIVPGAVLTDDDMVWEPWPSTAMSERFITQPVQVEGQTAADPEQELINMVARREIKAGEPMSRTMVIKQGDSGVTAANLAKGMRAITINVTPPQGVAGLVLPNDRVDIVMSLSVRDIVGLQGWRDVVLRYGAETIMKNLRVVAINQRLSHNPQEDGVGLAGNLVTLEVTPDQAEQLLVAQQLGPLTLALRSLVPGQNDTNMAQSYTMDVRASRSLSALVALGLEQDESEMPQTMADAMRMAKERAARRTDIKINRGGSIAIQKFGQ